jgi:hypothetical protein
MPESEDYQGFGIWLEIASYLVRLAYRLMKILHVQSRYLRTWESPGMDEFPGDSQVLYVQMRENREHFHDLTTTRSPQRVV